MPVDIEELASHAKQGWDRQQQNYGGTHNQYDRAAAAIRLGQYAGLGAGGFLAIPQIDNILLKHKVNGLGLGLGLGLVGAAALAEPGYRHYDQASHELRRRQYPDLYDENGKFIKVALFTPSAERVMANAVGRTHGLKQFASGGIFTPQTYHDATQGMHGLHGSGAFRDQADQMMARANPIGGYVENSEGLFHRQVLPEAQQQQLQSQAHGLYNRADTRNNRLTWLSENQGLKPQLQMKANLNQAWNKFKGLPKAVSGSFNPAEPAAVLRPQMA